MFIFTKTLHYIMKASCLGQGYSKEFQLCGVDLSNPLGFLEDPSRRRGFIEVFSFMNPETRNLSLLGNEYNCLEKTLDDMIGLQREGRALYQRWIQRKESKARRLSVPNKPFRNFIENYLLPLIKLQEVHSNCHGGEKGWSTKRSLESHLPCESVLSFDLEDAFENLDAQYVFDFFYLTLDRLSSEQKRDVAGFLTMLSTVAYGEGRGLPQGSPHSMALFNRILFPADKILNEKARDRGLTYTRWVDDMVISAEDIRGVEYFLGAVELVGEELPIAKHKVYFQRIPSDIYLLGYILRDGILIKNSKEEALRNKDEPLVFSDYFDDGKRNYESW